MFARKIAGVVPRPSHIPTLAGVSRVSLEIQVNNYSLDAQDFDFTAFEKSFGCRIPAEYRIADEGFQGADFNRPSIKRVVRWIREGKVEGVAYPHVDRFARDVEGGLALCRMITEAGGHVLIGNLGWYDGERNYRNQLTMYLLMAQNAKEDIRYKSLLGVAAKLRRGLVHGGGYSGPYGYRFVGGLELAMEAAKQGRTPDAKPQNVLRRVEENITRYHLMQDLVLKGESAAGVCRELIARGIPTARGGKWHPSTIGYILRDESHYTGIWYYNKTEGKPPEPGAKLRAKGDRHRINSSKRKRDRADWMPYRLEGGAITTKEKWLAVLEALDRNKTVCNGRPGDYELSGLVTCLVCGACVNGTKRTRKSGKVNRWYSCNNRDRATGEYLCDAHKLIRAEVLEEGVWEAMRRAVCHDLDRLVAEHRETILETTDTAEMERCQKELDRVTGKMIDASRLHDREDDKKLKEEYARQVSDWKGQKKMLERRLSSFSKEVEEISVDCKTIARTCARAFDTTDPARRRQILRAWVEGIRYANGQAELTLRIPKSSSDMPSEPSSSSEPCQQSGGGRKSPSTSGKAPIVCRNPQEGQHAPDGFDTNGVGFIYIKIAAVIQ